MASNDTLSNAWSSRANGASEPNDNFGLTDNCTNDQLTLLTDRPWSKASLVAMHSATVVMLGMHVRVVHASVEIGHPVFAIIFQVGLKYNIAYLLLRNIYCISKSIAGTDCPVCGRDLHLHCTVGQCCRLSILLYFDTGAVDLKHFAPAVVVLYHCIEVCANFGGSQAVLCYNTYVVNACNLGTTFFYGSLPTKMWT